MEMVDEFPFKHCEKCRNIAATAYASHLYSNNEIASTVIHVGCLNEDICKGLERDLRKELEGARRSDTTDIAK